MTLKVIGAGVGRTGTYSLKLAINELGFGPCHHMEEVLHNMATQVPLWSEAISDHADWSRIFEGYRSAVDWPTACFFRELHKEYPAAKFVLTVRDPEKWAESFGATIHELIANKDKAPGEMKAWLDMASDVISKTGFRIGCGHEALARAFDSHTQAVKRTVPSDRLLIFDVRDGWGPLCDFLEVPVPGGEFPRTNHREEFWDRVNGNI